MGGISQQRVLKSFWYCHSEGWRWEASGSVRPVSILFINILFVMPKTYECKTYGWALPLVCVPSVYLTSPHLIKPFPSIMKSSYKCHWLGMCSHVSWFLAAVVYLAFSENNCPLSK